MQSLSEIFGPDGPFPQLVDGFSPRAQQQEMAAAVAVAIEQQDLLVCEAGTGTGKTFAYLVPALLSGRRVIISTGTRNLQDQLFHRDLPLVRNALRVGAQAALLKGRANYLCLHRLEQTGGATHSLFPESGSDLQQIRTWAAATRTGDIAEVGGVSETSHLWPAVTSTAENCLGQECGYYQDCHVVKARRAAAAADIVVVNHHLFLADMVLREEGFAEVIPGADAVVFDEAHQLPELATQFFGVTVSSRQLSDLSRDVQTAQRVEAGDMPQLTEFADDVSKASDSLRQAFGARERREEWHSEESNNGADPPFAELCKQLDGLVDALEVAAERGTELQTCWRRAAVLQSRLSQFEEHQSETAVRWIEVQRRGYALHRTPVDIAEVFRARLDQHPCARVFTSATLAVGDSFDYFVHRLGLGEVTSHCWGSPFRFEQQALLYQPAISLEPRHADYTQAVIEQIVPVLEASNGRAFVLFTSHRALRLAEGLLRESGFELLVQGQAPKTELLDRFRSTARAVLLGTNSFWEGVDVRGDALSVVAIDKLPFASPDDPMLKARSALLREQNMNPFMDYQLPEAVLALKQGVGRLIRDENDHGVLVLCDPRIKTRSYGKRFIDGLPPMRRTEDIAEVEAFFVDRQDIKGREAAS